MKWAEGAPSFGWTFATSAAAIIGWELARHFLGGGC